MFENSSRHYRGTAVAADDPVEGQALSGPGGGHLAGGPSPESPRESALSKIQKFKVEFGPSRKDILNFTNQLAVMVRAGISLQDSLESISCLHVAEHIGLGRYGDPLDPLGTKKAADELTRCLAKDGNLYFSLPVGKPRLCFNAHRIHSPRQIIEYFRSLKLVELSGTDDNKKFMTNINIETLENSKYACGLFWFTKK